MGPPWHLILPFLKLEGLGFTECLPGMPLHVGGALGGKLQNPQVGYVTLSVAEAQACPAGSPQKGDLGLGGGLD